VFSSAQAPVARVVRRHALNANQVFYWRERFHEGQLGKNQSNKLLPANLAIDHAQTHGAWLILVIHRIDETGQKTSIPHELLQQIVDYLAEKNARVVTLREALDIYGLK
jgi:transposase-like protein